MIKKERLGFFKRIYLAITDFRLYPFVQREKTIAATSYFSLLLMLLTLFISLQFSLKVFDGISFINEGYDKLVPEFSLENGILNVEDKIYDLDGEVKFAVDTSYKGEEFAKTDLGKEIVYSKSFFVINSDGIVYSEDGGAVIYTFAPVSSKINKAILKQEIEFVDSNLSVKVAIFFITWLVLFFAYFILKMINALFLILISYMLNFMFGMKLKFSNYYRIVMYALTLPLIIETVSLLYIGRIPEYATFAYQLLAYIYIFYALRALKLDILLISTPGGSSKEKIENIIKKIENEVEEKLQRESKDIKEDESTDDIKKQDEEENKMDE